MAFGGLKGTFSFASTSVVNPQQFIGARTFTVATGDLIFLTIGQVTNLTANGVRDNRGGVYTALPGTDAGGGTGIAYYRVVTAATSGTITAISGSFTAGTTDVAIAGGIIEGPFSERSALAANTSPSASPVTVTINTSWPSEVALAWVTSSDGRSATTAAPFTRIVTIMSGAETAANSAGAVAAYYVTTQSVTGLSTTFTYAGNETFVAKWRYRPACRFWHHWCSWRC